MSKDILLYGTVYCPDQKNAESLLPYWYKCLQVWNPEILSTTHILLVDSNSPVDFAPLFPESKVKVHHSGSDDIFDYKLDPEADIEIVSFKSNIGHIPKTKGKDGGGRALCQGIHIAIENDMKYVVHVESDMFVKGSQWLQMLLNGMEERNCVFTAPFSYQHNILDTGFCAANTKHLSDIDFIRQYNWKWNYDLAEKGYERVLGDDYKIMGMVGCRNDKIIMHPQELMKHEYAYITHFRPLFPFYWALGLLDDTENPFSIFF